MKNKYMENIQIKILKLFRKNHKLKIKKNTNHNTKIKMSLKNKMTHGNI